MPGAFLKLKRKRSVAVENRGFSACLGLSQSVLPSLTLRISPRGSIRSVAKTTVRLSGGDLGRKDDAFVKLCRLNGSVLLCPTLLQRLPQQEDVHAIHLQDELHK